MFKPKYKLTDKIVKMLISIAETRSAIGRARILPKNELKLRRQALIRMSHSSTAIEGNQLNTYEVEALVKRKKIDAPQRDIFEVQNYLKALKYIEEVVQKKRRITEKVLLKIHKLVTDKTLPKEQSGYYRKSPVYVVRRRLGFPTEVIYTGPEAIKVQTLCSELISWINNSEEADINPVIVAGIVHQEIAAIHPFADGNGRTARAMATLILYKRGYDFRKLFALEDYYNKDRPSYYKAINIGKTYFERKVDFTPWLKYFILGFKDEIDNVKNKVATLSAHKVDGDVDSQIYLEADQMKILDFMDKIGKINVSDVVDVLDCPKRTAQFHLQKLKKIGTIKQVGKGPSSAYVLK
jgi:Fic family protein